MPRWELRSKLALLASGLTLLGLVLGLTAMYWSLLSARIAGLDDQGRLLASLVLEAAVVRQDDTVRVPRVVESYLTDLTGVSAAQVFLDGQLLWEGGVIDAPRPLDADRLLVGRGGTTVDDWRVFTVRDEDAGIVVQVGRPLQAVRKLLGSYGAIAVVVTLLASLLTGLLAWASVGAALRPLRRLTDAAVSFGADGPVPRIPGRDEPARLAGAFEMLLGRLKEERDREHAFLAYAAHELRTPLTALRAGLEAVDSGRLAPSPDLWNRLYRESMRLEALAQNLLALSRSGMGETRPKPLDLEDIAADAYDRFQPLAAEGSLELRLEGSSAPTHGDERLVAQALDNLVHNALRATRSGTVALSSGVDDGGAYLEVADTGTGLVEPVREGLGLRVARAVAAAHGGSFTLEEGPVGVRARLLLPAHEPPGG